MGNDVTSILSKDAASCLAVHPKVNLISLTVEVIFSASCVHYLVHRNLISELVFLGGLSLHLNHLIP